jgi:hypothetical protein
MKPNRLGWITSLSVMPQDSIIDVTSFGSSTREFISGSSSMSFEISGIAENPGALMEQFKEWMNSGISQPIYQKEYMCLYCGSPNKIEHTHCKKCGAPRSFVIG